MNDIKAEIKIDLFPGQRWYKNVQAYQTSTRSQRSETQELPRFGEARAKSLHAEAVCHSSTLQIQHSLPAIILILLAELKRLSERCEFGATSDEMLRESVVCGVRDSNILRRLLAEPKVSLKRALEVAIALEIAEKDALDLQKNQTPGLILQ